MEYLDQAASTSSEAICPGSALFAHTYYCGLLMCEILEHST